LRSEFCIMKDQYEKLANLAKGRKKNHWIYYETDIGTFRFSWRERRKRQDLFNIHYKSNDLMGFFNNGVMYMSDVIKLLKSHDARFLKLE